MLPVKNDILAALLLGAIGLIVGGLLAYVASPTLRTQVSDIIPGGGVAPASVTSPFIYSFNSNGVVEETGEEKESRSPYFWLNSGGRLIIKNGTGMTLQGDLSSGDTWFEEYAGSDPEDTKNGAQPQNLFRLLTRSMWNNARVSTDFYIAADNMLSSPNRNASNGLLFMSRYQDGDNLYYAGVRVDGTAVIKKKAAGTYYTMAQAPVFPGTYEGEQDDANLLPKDAWISLRMDTLTQPDGSVLVRLYMRPAAQGAWEFLVEAVDRGQYGNSEPFVSKAPVGIRTDFMDVQFKNFRVEEIAS